MVPSHKKMKTRTHINGIDFDFSALFNGKEKSREDLLSRDEFLSLQILEDQTSKHLQEIKQGKILSHGDKALFMDLPYQDEATLREIEQRACFIRENFDAVLSVGIGGSYLGNRAVYEALKGPYANFLHRPALFFLGNNLDPDSLQDVLSITDIRTSHIVVISKSGGTLEPLSCFSILFAMLRDQGLDPARHVTIITGKHGSLLEQFGTDQGIPMLYMPDSIGGRFSVLSVVGLLTSAAVGINIRQLLAGAGYILPNLLTGNAEENPALMLALTGHLFYQKGKTCHVLMPYSDRLTALGMWYIQLFAESLGKAGKGRTPLLAVGTTDMHAQTQQHQQGAKDKVITFLEVKAFSHAFAVPAIPAPLDKFKGLDYHYLMHLARRANEQALHQDRRPSSTITLEKLDAYTLGGLIMFFEVATVIEGLLLAINPFDQPGVEAYKGIMRDVLDSRPA